MAQSRVESTCEINNYGRYIDQFPPNIIKPIRHMKGSTKNMLTENVYYIKRNMYIYIYIYMGGVICKPRVHR